MTTDAEYYTWALETIRERGWIQNHALRERAEELKSYA